MITIRKLTLIPLLIGLWVFIPLEDLTAQKKDIIIRKGSGKKLEVDRILSESFQEVRYKNGNIESKIATDKVKDIQYYDAPESFKNGLSFSDKREYENATNSLKLAMEEKGVRSWIKTYCLFEMAKIYQQWGMIVPEKNQEAIKTYQELLQQDPESRFTAISMFNLAQCIAGSGDLNGAVKAFDRLAKEAYEKKLGVIWEARAKLEKAVARMNGGKLDDAERDFRSALTFTTEQAESGAEPSVVQELQKMAGLAMLNQGTVMIKKKNLNGARDFFEKIIKDETATRSIKAGAECGLGECLLSEKKLKEAQIQFAKTRVQYFDLEEAAHATYQLGLLCLELKDKEPNYKKRAREYFMQVTALYPDTEWAKLAKAKID
jgi:TolA-binding protein